MSDSGVFCSLRMSDSAAFCRLLMRNRIALYNLRLVLLRVQNLKMLFLRHRFCDQIGQIAGVYHSQLMQCTGRSYIQEFDIAVLRRIIFFRRVVQYHSVELQPFRIFHREDHDPLCEFSCFQVAVCKFEVTAEGFAYSGSCCLVPADDGDGLSAVRLPFPDYLCCFPDHV